MRHRKAGRKFGRSSGELRALKRSLAVALISHEVISTTLAKAKELRRFVEPLITRARKDTLANRRMVYSRLGNRKAVLKLFRELGPRAESKGRSGGYTRVIKAGYRKGDAAPLAYIELVDRYRSWDEASQNYSTPESFELSLAGDGKSLTAKTGARSSPGKAASAKGKSATEKSDKSKKVSASSGLKSRARGVTGQAKSRRQAKPASKKQPSKKK